MNEIKTMLPILKQLGISPEQLGPDKLSKIINIANNIRNPADISMEQSQKIMDILGVSTSGEKREPKISSRIKPNQKCPCGSDKKYKKCCRI